MSSFGLLQLHMPFEDGFCSVSLWDFVENTEHAVAMKMEEVFFSNGGSEGWIQDIVDKL